MPIFKIDGMRVDITGQNIEVAIFTRTMGGLQVFQNIVYALWERELGPKLANGDPVPFGDLSPVQKMTIVRNHIHSALRELSREGDLAPRVKQANDDNAAINHNLDYVPEVEIPIK